MSPVNIVIETPKLSNVKYTFEPGNNSLRLKKSLPLGMVFPYDFGFIPGTKGEDGDPLDAVMIAEFNSYPGCNVECRLIGALLANQTEGKKTIRNDRFFFVPVDSMIYNHIRSMNQFSSTYTKQLKDFFTNYNAAEGKVFKPLRFVNATEALKLLVQGKQ